MNLHLRYLVKELVLKFGIAQCRAWFLCEWKDEYFDEINNGMKSVGHEYDLSDQECSEIGELFITLDAIHWCNSKLSDPNKVLDLSIAQWANYLDELGK